MQASVRTNDRAIIQLGESLGPRLDCAIVALTVQNEIDLRAAFAVPHGLVYLAVNGTVTADPYVPPVIPPPDPQIASDKVITVAFMNSVPGTPTPAQIETTLRAVIRYLRRAGSDA